MKTIKQGYFEGERSLFQERDTKIIDSVFENGESPLKESRHIELQDSIFRWKYPLWYARHVQVHGVTLTDTARSGIWYSHDLSIRDSIIQGPKTFRRASQISLDNVQLPNAEETLWNCDTITLKNVQVNGDYFGMNSKHIKADGLVITGNYAFDGAEDVEITNSKLLTKDAFWNCKRVVIKDSTIIGEYLGWNTEDITFINCRIESNQGLCYMKHVTLENCTLINTDLAFEYVEDLYADIRSQTISVKNPISGEIVADGIGEVIFDDPAIDPRATKITSRKGGLAYAV